MVGQTEVGERVVAPQGETVTNIVLLSKDRWRLTQQAIISIVDHTPSNDYTLTVVDDGSTEPWYHDALDIHQKFRNNHARLSLFPGTGLVGGNRNLGAWYSEQAFGRGDYLCFLDNDVYCKLKWLDRLIAASRSLTTPFLLGGCQHPYHGSNGGTYETSWGSARPVDAVAGYSMFMNWDTYGMCGPFVENQKGIGASEDFKFSQDVKKAGGMVAYIHPPCLLHCGITNSDGKPAVGADQFIREENVLFL